MSQFPQLYQENTGLSCWSDWVFVLGVLPSSLLGDLGGQIREENVCIPSEGGALAHGYCQCVCPSRLQLHCAHSSRRDPCGPVLAGSDDGQASSWSFEHLQLRLLLGSVFPSVKLGKDELRHLVHSGWGSVPDEARAFLSLDQGGDAVCLLRVKGGPRSPAD